jgi:hypothetical protein
MALKITKTELWSVTIDDQAGGAAGKIEPLSTAGANFEFVFARRTPERPGKGVVFVTPVKGAKVVQAAKSAGFEKSANMHSLRVEGSDKPGAVARIMRSLAGAAISFRAVSANAVSRKFVCYVALDSAEDAARAASLLRKLG